MLVYLGETVYGFNVVTKLGEFQRISVDLNKVERVHFNGEYDQLEFHYTGNRKPIILTVHEENAVDYDEDGDVCGNADNYIITDRDHFDKVCATVAQVVNERRCGFVSDSGGETDYHNWWAFTDRSN